MTPPSHPQDFESLEGYSAKARHDNAVVFDRLLSIVKPGATGKELLAFFQHRTTKQKICDYRKGRRWPPQWTLDIMRAELTRRHHEAEQIIRQIPVGVGRKAGAVNLARWKAHRFDAKS